MAKFMAVKETRAEPSPSERAVIISGNERERERRTVSVSRVTRVENEKGRNSEGRRRVDSACTKKEQTGEDTKARGSRGKKFARVRNCFQESSWLGLAAV